MVIGIVGNYGNNNHGDESILEGILVQLEKRFSIERKNIIVFSNQPEQTEAKYGVQSAKLYYKKNNNYRTLVGTLFRNWSLIKKCDLLLVGGGGIFMDLYGREAFLFGMYGWIGKLTGTPVVLYGVGAGPIITKKGEFMLKSLAHLAKLVTVRDPKSKELLKEIGVKSPIYVIGDPAFQVPAPTNEIKGQLQDTIQIGVTAVPYYHISYWPEENKTLYDNYIKGMAENLDYLLEKYPNAQVNFFATKYPQDIRVTEEIQELMTHQNRTNIKDEYMDHKQIVEFASKQDVVIGTRLHSLILSLVTNTPIIAVSYHHKVQHFMDMIHCSEYTYDIDELYKSHTFFYESFANIESNWEAETKRFAEISKQMKDKAIYGMDLVSQAMELKNKKNKVLVLSNMYPSKHSRTFGIFVKNQVELLRENGLDVDVIAISDPRKGKFNLLRKYGIFFWRGFWNAIFKGGKYEAVHVHYIFPTGLIGLLFKKLRRKKLIVTSHGGDIDQMSKKSGTVQKYTKKILANADHVIAVGEKLKEEIHETFDISEDKVSVINMGVNRQVFHEKNKAYMRKKLNIPSEQKVLLFVGNLIYAKGLDDLVAAFEKVQAAEPNAALHLIGEPKDAAYFEKLKASTDQNDSIYIHGGLPQAEVADWMAAADVFVLPSHIEGFGLVALEAMACGLPVVGTDVGGLSYLLADGAGVKAAPQNPEDLAEKILLVLQDESLQASLKEKGLEKAEENNQNTLINEILNLYGIEESRRVTCSRDF